MTQADSPQSSRPQTAPAPPVKKGFPFAGVVVVIAMVLAIIVSRMTPVGTWAQAYDPTGQWWLSTLIAAIPIAVLLGTLGLLHFKAHYAALLGLASAVIVAIGVFHMPVKMAGTTVIFGAAFGLFPIGWIILNVIFM
jgi:lactate permease